MTSFQTVVSSGESALVCHCRRVPYETVEAAISGGRVASLADVQRQTTACTRCFGCRFELERMLRERLGEGYVRAPIVTSPSVADRSGRLHTAPSATTRRMYMPVLSGFRGYRVDTRVIVCNWADDGSQEHVDVPVRADLLALDGTRRHVWRTVITPRCSAVIEVGPSLAASQLPGGIGVVKLVVESAEIGSLRPYFHLVTPTGVTSTHEKAGLRDPGASGGNRGYYWVFPIAGSPVREEAYFVCTNTRSEPIEDRELIWRSVGGAESRVPLPAIGLDQTACVALHDHFPAIGDGTESGTVRLSPSIHVAGFMLRHDPQRQLWRVQHL